MLPQTGKEKHKISQVINKLVKHQNAANVYIIRNITIPAKSYLFLSVKINKGKRQPTTETLKDRFSLEDLTMKMSTDNPTVLVINPTSCKISLPQNTPIAYTEDDLEIITTGN